MKKSYEQISEDLRVWVANAAPLEQQRKKLQRESKSFIQQTISFSFDIEAAVKRGTGELGVQDSNFAVKGLKKHLLRQGDEEQKSLFIKEFEPAYREVMAMRNTAAHAPREKKYTFRKKDIANLYPKVEKVIAISTEFV